MKIAVSDIRIMLTKEIRWHVAHKEQAVSIQYAEGFIEGLKQARFLIRKCAEVLK